MDEASGGFTMPGPVFLLCLFLLCASVFSFGLTAGYALRAERAPAAACKCGTGVNTGAVIGDVR